MNRSINEVEALAKKAARGAGMSWGLAEETGRCIASLETMGLPGAEALVTLLKQNDSITADKLRPQSLTGTWTSITGHLCPVIAGACLSDCSDVLQAGEKIEMQEVSCPLLVLPFVKSVARSLGLSLTLKWDGIDICTDGYAVAIQGERQKLTTEHTAHLSCGENDHRQVLRGSTYRAKLDEACFNTLARLAHRTYAPATEESRRLGAGAGQTDND